MSSKKKYRVVFYRDKNLFDKPQLRVTKIEIDIESINMTGALLLARNKIKESESDNWRNFYVHGIKRL